MLSVLERRYARPIPNTRSPGSRRRAHGPARRRSRRAGWLRCARSARGARSRRRETAVPRRSGRRPRRRWRRPRTGRSCCESQFCGIRPCSFSGLANWPTTRADDEHCDQDQERDSDGAPPRRRSSEREEVPAVEAEGDQEEDAQDQRVLDEPEDARAPLVGHVLGRRAARELGRVRDRRHEHDQRAPAAEAPVHAGWVTRPIARGPTGRPPPRGRAR